MLWASRAALCLLSQRLASAWAQPRCFHWLLRDARALKAPVPCAGQIQLWELSAQVSAAIQAQLP